MRNILNIILMVIDNILRSKNFCNNDHIVNHKKTKNKKQKTKNKDK